MEFMSTTDYLPVMILGIVAALASLQSFPDVRQKKLLFQLIFYAGILTQIATQGLQYFNAVGRHKVLDREFAYALFAYTRDDPKLLREFAKETPYVTGYRLFKDVPPRLEEAKVYFNKSITKRQFVASSHYMLGTIERMQHPNDFKRARKEFDEAIKADEEYAASYYGRAITELMGTERDERDAALKDLSMALIYEEGDLICLTINSETELKMYWERVTSDVELNKKLKELQAGCMKG